MNTATIVTNSTVANSKQCPAKARKTVETRIIAHQEHIDEIVWNVEWRKNHRDKWRKYCKCSNVGDAECYRGICVYNHGKYPVSYTERWGNTKFRVVGDFGYFLENMMRIDYKHGLGKWHSFGHYDGLSVAQEVIQKVKDGKRHLPKYGVRKLLDAIHKTVESTVLCIRFPFLYPRNRFSGLHHTNWKLSEKLDAIHAEAFECTNKIEFHKGLTEEELNEMKHPKYRIKNLGKSVEYGLLKMWWYFDRLIHCVPTSTELDAMDTGWLKAFGIEMCKEIKVSLKKTGYLRKYRVMQIKEKWGELCWYDAGAPQEVFDIIRKYEGISYRTCIECGRPAKYRTTGWVEPYCEECMPKKSLEPGKYEIV